MKNKFNLVKTFYRRYISYLYAFCISINSYFIGYKLKIDDAGWNILFYAAVIIMSLYSIYDDIKNEAKALNKDFTIDLKNQFHINMQIIVVLNFLVGYIYDNKPAQLLIVMAYSFINYYMMNRKIDKYFDESDSENIKK